VLLSEEAEHQLRVWTQATQGEFSCFGVVEKAEDSGLVVINKFFLPKQVCSGAHTSPDRQAMGQLMTELVKAGYDVANLRCWAHSHGDLQTFWSGEDNDTVNQMDNGEWLLSIVTNRAGSFLARLDLYRPFRVTFDKVPLHFQSSAPHDEALAAELRAKVNADLPDCTLRPTRQNREGFLLDDYPFDLLEMERNAHDNEANVLLDLQDCGLSPDEAAKLVQAVKTWPGGDIDAFWKLLADALPEADWYSTDAWGILDVLSEYGLLPNDLGPMR